MNWIVCAVTWIIFENVKFISDKNFRFIGRSKYHSKQTIFTYTLLFWWLRELDRYWSIIATLLLFHCLSIIHVTHCIAFPSQLTCFQIKSSRSPRRRWSHRPSIQLKTQSTSSSPQRVHSKVRDSKHPKCQICMVCMIWQNLKL